MYQSVFKSSFIRIAFLFVILTFVSSCYDEVQTKENQIESRNKEPERDNDIVFKAKTEKVVEQGEMFQLTYELNSRSGGFSPPDFGVFDVLSGPSTSSFSSTQIINGKSTKQVSNSYTYTLSCQEAGEHTIPEAEVTINNISYKSNPVSIKIIDSGNNATQSNGSKKIQNVKDDIFIASDFSKTEVFNGEYIIATTKIYTRVDFRNINEVKFSEFEGFWTKILQAPRQISFQNEIVNGKKYKAAVLKQTLLFAQKPGKYEIPPYIIDIQIQKKDGKGRDFFGNIVDTYKLINNKLSTKKETIIVKPLPTPIPKKFLGITGSDFTISASVDTKKINSDESINLKVKITGNGNIHLLNDMMIQFPKNIESFKPEVENTESYSGKGAFGEANFNYIIVGKEDGSYTIDPIEFVYFNPKKNSYETIQSEKFDIIVGSGISSGTDVSNSKTISNKDIRYIKENITGLIKVRKEFFGSALYYLLFLLIILLFFIGLTIRKRVFSARSDVKSVKRRKAGDVSKKRLKLAKNYLKNEKYNEFYKEILSVLWGYLSDKLSMSADLLTNENVHHILTKKALSGELIKDFLDLTETCGYAQYSPDSEESKPRILFERAKNIINKLEEVL